MVGRYHHRHIHPHTLGDTMTVKVEPDDLRKAGATIGQGGHGSGEAAAGGIGEGGSGIAGTSTAAALQASGSAASQAVQTVRGRMEEWQNVLNESAANYHDTDTGAANRMKALGDFNHH